MDFDVFISHSSSCRKTVIEICKALEAQGIACWYAPRNIVSQYAGDIAKAIKKCKIFLLVLNEVASESMHVQNEIDLVCQRIQAKEEVVVLPFKLDQKPIAEAIHYYICRMHFMDGTAPPEEERIQELIERIKCLLDKSNVIQKTINDQYNQTKQYGLRSSYAYPDNSFVRRENEIISIHDHLTDTQNKLIMIGIGGIGKSEIAKKYLKQYSQDYHVVLWIDFHNSLKETISSDYSLPIQGLQRSMYPSDTDDQYFLRKLDILKSIAGREVLFVVDNFDRVEDPDLNQFLAGEYGILFTSRYHQNNHSLPELTIEPFNNEEELIALFQTEYKRAISAEDKQWLQKLINLFDYHTLSIRLLAAAMQNRRIKPEKMYQLVEKHKLQKENTKAYDMIFGRLKEVFQLSSFTADELYIMKNLSIIPLSGIEVERLFDWIEMDDYDVIDNLIQKNWVIHDPISDEVHLHPLISQLIREQYDYNNDIKKYMMKLKRFSFESERANQKERMKISTFIDHLLDLFSEESPYYIDILTSKANSEIIRSNSNVGLAYFQKVMQKTNEGATHLEDYLWALFKTAHVLVLRGHPQTCLEYAKKGLAIIDNLPSNQITGRIPMIRCSLRGRVGEASIKLGNYDEAIQCFLENKTYYLAQNDPEKNIGWQDFHICNAYLKKGDIDQAKIYGESSLQYFIQLNDTWSTMFAYENLAKIELALSHYDESLSLLNQSMNMHIEIDGPSHANTALCIMTIADVYAQKGDIKIALEEYEKAKNIFEKLSNADLTKQIKQKIDELNSSIIQK